MDTRVLFPIFFSHGYVQFLIIRLLPTADYSDRTSVYTFSPVLTTRSEYNGFEINLRSVTTTSRIVPGTNFRFAFRSMSYPITYMWPETPSCDTAARAAADTRH